METNNSSAIPLSQKHLDTPSSWEDKSQPNFDYHTAKQKYDKAMIEFAILKCDHDSEPSTVFTQQTLSELNTYLNKQSPTINQILFNILADLLTDLQAGITADLQLSGRTLQDA